MCAKYDMNCSVKIFSMISNRNSQVSFYIESLGCAKNSVDSRSIAEILINAGYYEVADPDDADVLIVNTCGFIQPAKEESIGILRELSSKKKRDQILIAAGCLSEREKNLITSKVKGLDAVYGTRHWGDILRILSQLRRDIPRPHMHFPVDKAVDENRIGVHRVAVYGASAYLKIAEGCDRGCAFCAIPYIKGPMISRPIKNILDDAAFLQEKGVKEIILIAQDTTSYGKDLGLSDGLPVLLGKLLRRVPEVPWIRIMYMFPGSVSGDLIALMADNDQILPYMDIPLQHASPDVLKRMRRPYNTDAVRNLLENMRKAIPFLALRSTFIIGYPGEADEDFDALKDFIRQIKFDHVGFFPYYHEKGTPSYNFPDDVSPELKEERIQEIAGIQEEISLEKNKGFIGKNLEVLIEGNGDGISIGRSYRDAPEIDGLVILNEIVETNQIYKIRVCGALIHDLIAQKIE